MLQKRLISYLIRSLLLYILINYLNNFGTSINRYHYFRALSVSWLKTKAPMPNTTPSYLHLFEYRLVTSEAKMAMTME